MVRHSLFDRTPQLHAFCCTRRAVVIVTGYGWGVDVQGHVFEVEGCGGVAVEAGVRGANLCLRRALRRSRRGLRFVEWIVCYIE